MKATTHAMSESADRRLSGDAAVASILNPLYEITSKVVKPGGVCVGVLNNTDAMVRDNWTHLEYLRDNCPNGATMWEELATSKHFQNQLVKAAKKNWLATTLYVLRAGVAGGVGGVIASKSYHKYGGPQLLAHATEDARVQLQRLSGAALPRRANLPPPPEEEKEVKVEEGVKEKGDGYTNLLSKDAAMLSTIPVALLALTLMNSDTLTRKLKDLMNHRAKADVGNSTEMTKNQFQRDKNTSKEIDYDEDKEDKEDKDDKRFERNKSNVRSDSDEMSDSLKEMSVMKSDDLPLKSRKVTRPQNFTEGHEVMKAGPSHEELSESPLGGVMKANKIGGKLGPFVTAAEKAALTKGGKLFPIVYDANSGYR